MNHISLLFILYSPFIHSYILLFYLLFITITSYAADPKFDACQPKICGNNQIISYPFYIEGAQESFCGYPGFGISCDPNGFPILSFSDTQYTIHQIFYQNQSLLVSNPVFSTLRPNISQGCLQRTQNLTLPNNTFHLAPNQKDVTLFYGCDLPSLPRELQEHKIGCYVENGTSSVLAMYKEDKNISLVSNNCTGGVADATVEDGIGEIEEALRKGFFLQWTASDCSVCSSTGGRCGFDADMYSFRCFCTEGVHSVKCAEGSRTRSWVVKVELGLGLAVTVALLLVMVRIYYTRWKKKNPTNQRIEVFLKRYGPLQIKKFGYSEIKKVTNSFKNKLGQGGFGSVYKGQLQDGRYVAVKVLSELKDDGEDFINEVATISRTSHINIVSLLGFCFEGSKRALVYEFMSNGSLEKFIFEGSVLMTDCQLDCQMLYHIAIGVARGLEYLHKGCNTRILHFDIKPHNILLDENFNPKISDFGLAKICTRKESAVSIFGARGTAGYIAPEVFSRNFGTVSHKSDVYSYGMMILDMVGTRKNVKAQVDHSSEIYFPHWIYKHLESNQELGLRIIRNENDSEKVRKMTMVGLWCIQTDPSTRPNITKVVEMLEGTVELLPMPPKPFLSPSTFPVDSSCESSIVASHS
ncbi:LEAF RUST 10 DISEASE-RESISTANCE LOCUS RECEPTOR-LIKE PROTEIN KINASE-like 2.1 [Abrus precatorius]|uniref:non-specific serine/threonine protein kinase n=1 Tax=Abrus precatorius TaxID=3816 RepID=A0A8B8MA35_ABRPR|nr:LEAF RUST 10 DISEASE-RESISTANCE LOCUS RECEPTOR-LIKE PROTEIN KINASE-like 2.1 [Abrus precatorius]